MSATTPWNSGTMAPPTMAVASMPEAWLVCRPRPRVASEKMVGNMMELKKPQASRQYMATCPPCAMASEISSTFIMALNDR